MRRFPHSGFSLSELLISILILSTLSVLLVGVIPASIIGLKGAGQRANAAILARQSLEEIRRDGFSHLPDVGTVSKLPRQVANGTEYDVEIHIEQATDSDGNPISPDFARLIVVAVRWRSHTGSVNAQSQKEYQAVLPLYKEL